MAARKVRRRVGAGRGPKKLQLGLRVDDPIDYKDIELLQKCVGSQGQIFARRRTALTAKQQRRLKVAIKRARHLALLSFVG